MQWLTSGVEPESLYVPILTEERLRAGAVRELIALLPWYKRTPRMEPILASHLDAVLRSGFERSYVLRQLESLDVPPDAADAFLRALEEAGACRFGEPRLFYNQVVHAAKCERGVLVRGRYLKNRVVVSETLARCLGLIDGFMPREEYVEAVCRLLGGEEHARRACGTLARLGLLLGCDSTRPATLDHGPARWNLELTDGARPLSPDEWAHRLRFVEESFRGFYFQSRGVFAEPPVQLWADVRALAESAGPGYFWALSFKLQKFGRAVPVHLRLAAPLPEGDWHEFAAQAPLLFSWNLVADLRGDGGGQTVKELEARLAGRPAGRSLVTVLNDGGAAAAVAPLGERAGLRFFFAGRPAPVDGDDAPLKFRRAVHRAGRPRLRREGCGALLSLYVDGRGGVHTCPLEGAASLGHIEDGARAVEERRQELLRALKGACRFGLDPCAGRDCRRGAELSEACREDVGGEWTPQPSCCP